MKSKTQSQQSISATPVEGVPRIALIGCGAIAQEYYLPALSKNPSLKANLVLVDRDASQAQKLAAQFGIKSWFPDYRQVLGEVDGVIIAVPTHLHHPISLEFLGRGVPVLCEKPLAESGDRASELVEQADRHGARLAVNYLQRLIPSFAKVKEIFASGALGEPISIYYSVSEEFRWPTVSGFYFNSPTIARGVLRDRGAHVVDHVCWWLGEKPTLLSSQNDSFGGSEAVARVQFRHHNCTGEIRLCWLVTAPSKFRIVCEKGAIEGDVYDYQNIVLVNATGQKQKINLQSKEKTKADIANRIVINFVDVICKGVKPLVAGRDVLNSIEFIDECYAAVRPFDMPWYERSEVLRG